MDDDPDVGPVHGLNERLPLNWPASSLTITASFNKRCDVTLPLITTPLSKANASASKNSGDTRAWTRVMNSPRRLSSIWRSTEMQRPLTSVSAQTGRVGRQAKGGGRTKSGSFKQGIATVAMFVLVPRVKLKKRLNVARAAGSWARRLPALMRRQMRSR